jgi:hypothetical protein
VGPANTSGDLRWPPPDALCGFDSLGNSASGAAPFRSITYGVAGFARRCRHNVAPTHHRRPCAGGPGRGEPVLGTGHLGRSSGCAGDTPAGHRGNVHGKPAPGRVAGECGRRPADRERTAHSAARLGRGVSRELHSAQERISDRSVRRAELSGRATLDEGPEPRSVLRTRTSSTGPDGRPPCETRWERSRGRTRGREFRS